MPEEAPRFESEESSDSAAQKTAASETASETRLPQPSGPSEPERYSYQTATIPDTEASRDSLGFAPYVRAMATFLTNPRTQGPLTVSIEGEWGSGKSSFMAQLRDALPGAAAARESKLSKPLATPIIVKFNAWRHDKAEELWAAFALNLLRSISRQLKFRRRWRGHIQLLKLRFHWRQGWLDLARFVVLLVAVCVLAVTLPLIVGEPAWGFLTQKLKTGNVETWDRLLHYSLGVGGALGYLAVVLSLFLRLKTFIGDPFSIDLRRHLRTPDYGAKASFIEQFQNDFQRILDAYVDDRNRKVICFIDDLDRCEVPKAAELMQALNLMISDDRRMVFLLGMDRKKVAAGLAVKFKDVIPFLSDFKWEGADGASAAPLSVAREGLRFGHDFIEKFIQIGYSLPRSAEQNIRQFLKGLSPPPHFLGEKGKPAGPRRLRSRGFGWTLPDWLRRRDASARTTPEAQSSEQQRSEEEAKRETQKQLVRLVELEESEEDPAFTEELVRMVAPCFDYNPRRLKQFLNLFRLNVATANATQLLYAEEGSSGGGVRLEQIGKFVALRMRWPDVVSELQRRPEWLGELCQAAYGNGEWAAPSGLNDSERLRELLQAGCMDEKGKLDLKAAQKWGLQAVNPRHLLEVSPAAPAHTLTTEIGTVTAVGKKPEDGLEYVHIPPGSFQMGCVPGDREGADDEKPPHRVDISQGFWISRGPVTVRAYRLFAEATRPAMPLAPAFNIDWEKEDHPIVNVSWEDAAAYCEWAGGRLPTEAEWEYAARGGKGGLKYPWGDEISQLDANYGGNVGGTSAVGSYPANRFGLHDMAGNVWEWVVDWGDEDYYKNSPTADPQGPESGKARVLRGGAWSFDSVDLRVSVRNSYRPDDWDYSFGFRCARETKFSTSD